MIVDLRLIVLLSIMYFTVGVCCYVFGWWYRGHYEREKRYSRPCPHGYDDWDDCPQCYH